MNQELIQFDNIIITFSWLSDSHVYVKYFQNSKEISTFDQFDRLTQIKVKRLTNAFENRNPQLLMYSY